MSHIKISFKNYITTFMPKGYKPGYLIKDILSGIIVAMISIPISMGYSQIAGLPMIYGLYGSLLPILVYGLCTSTRDFVFGVDAAPAALTGGVIAALGVTAESSDACQIVPTITLFTAIWLLLFYCIKADRAVKYISTPVMGGFITGICLEIILMQLPKLFGGTAGTGELFELLSHTWSELSDFSLLSFVLGIVTLIILRVSARLIPKIPMSIIVMLVGALISYNTELPGVTLLPEVSSGLPGFVVPMAPFELLPDIAFNSLTIALVIMCETLLASKQNAMHDGYTLRTYREVLGYSLANLIAAFTGCCPVNGSVSRTSIVRQFGARSQLMSVSASVTMGVILCFFTGFVKYLPIPVLTAIIISALLSAAEFHLAARLMRESRRDFIIFMAAMLGVLLFGTIYGVIIGVILSFISVIYEAVLPPRSFMGIIPGRDGFYTLRRNKNAVPIEHVIIYRFGGNLFFANVDTFEDEIRAAINDDTHVVIIYGSGIGNIDITAADRLVALNNYLKSRSIRFYITEHDGHVNDRLRRYGAGELLLSGVVRKTVDSALRAAGIDSTHSPVSKSCSDASSMLPALLDGLTEELEWVLGDDAEAFKEKLAAEILNILKKTDKLETEHDIVHLEKLSSWGRLSYMDEDEILDIIEESLHSAIKDSDAYNTPESKLEQLIDERRHVIEQRIEARDPEGLRKLRERRAKRTHNDKKN